MSREHSRRSMAPRMVRDLLANSRLLMGYTALVPLGRTERGPEAYPFVTARPTDGRAGASPIAIHYMMTAQAATEGLVAHAGINMHQDALCACGSGLRSSRCCELDPTFATPPEARERADILANCAAKALACGDSGAAEARSLDVLDIAPPFCGCPLDPLSNPPAFRSRAGGISIVAATRRSRPQQRRCHPGIGDAVVPTRRLSRRGTSCAKCSASRTGTSAVAQFDGHDSDRSSASAYRRVSLSSRPGNFRCARPDPIGQPGLEPQVPGKDRRGARALQRIR